MYFKNVISGFTLLVSGLAAYFAHQASIDSQEQNKSEFEIETSLVLLKDSYAEIQDDTDPQKAALACIFVQTLAKTEKEARSDAPFPVNDFITQVSDANLWNADCSQRLENLSVIAPTVTSTTEGDGFEVGKWHALIASYNITPKGCAESKDDIKFFGEALTAPEFKGLPIYVVQTQISKNYAVSVDTGDDRELANKVSAAIRDIASTRSDPTGSDSFVQGNRGWVVAKDCTLPSKIGG